jgi:hypothetical protein
MSELEALDRGYSPCRWKRPIHYAKKPETYVIAGQAVEVATVERGCVLVLFDDQSNVEMKTTGAASVRKAKADFKIEFEDGSSATFCLARSGLFRCGTRQRTMQSNISGKSCTGSTAQDDSAVTYR